MRVIAKRLAYAALGFLGVVATVFYFAWTLSLVQPVDWTAVAPAALFLAPIGLLAGASPE